MRYGSHPRSHLREVFAKLEGGHGDGQVIPKGALDLRDSYAALHKDGKSNPCAPKFTALFDESDAQHGGAGALAGSSDLNGSVSVSIGFDNCNNSDARADMSLNPAHVMFNGSEFNNSAS
jgi:hypothetical protein